MCWVFVLFCLSSQACGDPKAKPSYLIDKNLESAVKFIVRKFPAVETRNNNVSPRALTGGRASPCLLMCLMVISWPCCKNCVNVTPWWPFHRWSFSLLCVLDVVFHSKVSSLVFFSPCQIPVKWWLKVFSLKYDVYLFITYTTVSDWVVHFICSILNSYQTQVQRRSSSRS